jgi:preprotein translocase subunit SecA
MESDDISEIVAAIREEVVNDVISGCIPPQSIEEQWDVARLEQELEREFAVKLPVQAWLDEDDDLHEESLRVRILENVVKVYREKEDVAGAESMRAFEKQIFLHILDTLWKEHLASMDFLRQGIHLRSYAQKNPKQEYKKEAFAMFETLLNTLKHDIVRITSHVKIQSQEELEEIERQRKAELDAQLGSAKAEHADASMVDGDGEQGDSGATEQRQEPMTRDGRKVGRNEPCPCGSGKKFKQCHGQITA